MRKVVKMFRFGKVINMFRWVKEHRPHFRKPRPTRLNNAHEVIKHFGADGPLDLGRMFYKHTACGPWTAFTLKETIDHPAGVKRDELAYSDFKHHLSLLRHIPDVIGLRFGAIVEGTDREAEPVSVVFPCWPEDIDTALQNVDEQVTRIWNATHGCPFCYHGGDEEAWAEDTEPRHVNPDCDECSGDGIIV